MSTHTHTHTHTVLTTYITLQNGGIVAVQQTNLDVEVWVNASLHVELAARGKVYHSLNDYDLQLAGVSTTDNLYYI